MHARNLRLYVNVAVATSDSDLKPIAANSDGIVLMNYDQHQTTSDPGPIASAGLVRRQPAARAQDRAQRQAHLRAWATTATTGRCPFPTRKIASIRKPQVLDTEDLSVSDAWQRASDADADLDLDYDTLNPHFEYIDEDNNQRHVVWFLDGVTVLNEMRAARAAWPADLRPVAAGRGRQLAVEYLGPAQRSRSRCRRWARCQPGHDVDTEGEGDILRVTGLPQPGKRTVEVDTDEPDPRKKLIVDEHMDVYPRTYTIEQYGYHPNEVALSFDDGPDPKWTPKILDILKQKHVKGTFMLIGDEAAEQCRPDAAHRARRQRDRQPHLDPSRHQRNLQRASWIWRST